MNTVNDKSKYVPGVPTHTNFKTDNLQLKLVDLADVEDP